jgi:hypothetical protein
MHARLLRGMTILGFGDSQEVAENVAGSPLGVFWAPIEIQEQTSQRSAGRTPQAHEQGGPHSGVGAARRRCDASEGGIGPTPAPLPLSRFGGPALSHGGTSKQESLCAFGEMVVRYPVRGVDGVVGRAIVDDNELPVPIRLAQAAVDRPAYVPGPAVRRQHDGDFGSGRSTLARRIGIGGPSPHCLDPVRGHVPKRLIHGVGGVRPPADRARAT